MEGPVYRKSIEFSIQVIGLYKEMIKNQEHIISKQLLKSGTSIGANVHEATSAQSKKDFINKMSIALNEAKETRYWLIILSEGNLVSYNFSGLLGLVDELIKIISKIIITSKNNLINKTS